MKRLQQRIKIAILGALFVAVTATSNLFSYVGAVSVTPQPPELPASPLLLTSYQVGGGAPQYLQIFNASNVLVTLDDWVVEMTMRYQVDSTTMASAETTFKIELSGYLKPNYYMVLANDDSVGGADASFTIPADFPSIGVQKIALENSQYIGIDKASQFSEGQRYDLSKSSAGNYTSTSSFRVVASDAPLYGGGLYEIPNAPPLRVVTIAANAKQCGPFDRDPACREYVTVQNIATEAVVLDGYRLRIGYGNQSSSIDNTIPLTGKLASGEFLSLTSRSDGKPLSITASGGFVWLEDFYGLVKYENTEVSYQNIGDRARKGQVWGLDSATNTWRWAVAAFNSPNDFNVPEPVVAISALKPCAPNQYRSLETNRCRLLSTTSSSRVPCKPGQYRSIETNRCRSLVTLGSNLTPCKVGQFRNPATNRCKSANVASSTLKPCTPDQRRNPETNRCRKIAAAPPSANFAVEPIKQGAEEFVGWWALVGIVTVAGLYAGWEWRREIANAVIKMRGVFWHDK